MNKIAIVLTAAAIMVISGCSSIMPGKYRIKHGLGTYYVDSYRQVSGCTTFKYYIAGEPKGYRQVCGHVEIERLK